MNVPQALSIAFSLLAIVFAVLTIRLQRRTARYYREAAEARTQAAAAAGEIIDVAERQNRLLRGIQATLDGAYVCPRCGAASWHPEDKRNGYCGRCKAFTGGEAVTYPEVVDATETTEARQ